MNVLIAATVLAAAISEVHLLPMPSQVARPALRHVAARDGKPRGVVLFIHGATFPSALSFAYPIEGRSWMQDLAGEGFDVWALDFAGYGRADRDPRMRDDADAHAPLGRAKDVVLQIGEAIAFIRKRQPGARVSIVAHSWGTIPAAMYVSAHPEHVERFVMYGPVFVRQEKTEPGKDAWFFSTSEEQWRSFLAGIPEGRSPAIDRNTFNDWFDAYVASDPLAADRKVKVPAGPIADFTEMIGGKALYDASAIRVPTLVLRGEWDAATTAADAIALYSALTNAPLKRMVWVSEGTHRMHLEKSRRQVYREVQLFVEGGDENTKAR